MTDRRRNPGLVLLPVCGFSLLHLLGVWVPDRLWGTDQLHYYPASLAIMSLALVVVLLLLAAHDRNLQVVDEAAGRFLGRFWPTGPSAQA
ncbi:MAG TPA: hypothetical protein QGF95_26850 [Candidatus Latescibacteria bacterium]|nr:hypothetical protein [Candidatus Latescibacterota bacterium]HJP34183.1 hypothetical protein [Candidatus Latescibacterota bacterium]